MTDRSRQPAIATGSGSWLRSPQLDRLESFWREPPLKPWWSWWYLPELLAVFAIGVCLMNFLFLESAAAGGVPGHDSWYHVKMAQLLPEIGATRDFPWLQRVYFNQLNRDLVSHHFGFHALLVPFIHVAEWMGRDALTGARWAMAAFFAASLTVFHLILMIQGVRFRWVWLALFLLMPSQFFSRQAYVRAITPSLTCMLILLALMFRRRYVWTGLGVVGFIQIYLGGAIYAPVVVVCYALAGFLGPPGERVSWRLCLWTLLGWMVGVIVYPYFDGMFEFLQLQIFGSGLSPDISVGSEWKPYAKVWLLTQRCAWTLVPLIVAIILRLRKDPRINAPELSVVLVSLVFGGLMLKSRRFIEYWPVFALLATALLAGPVLDRWYATARRRLLNLGRSGFRLVVGVGLLAVGATLAALTIGQERDPKLSAIIDQWPVWTALVALYALTPLTRFWSQHRSPTDEDRTTRLTGYVVLLAGLGLATAVALTLRLVLGPTSDAGLRLLVPWWIIVLLVAAYLALPRWAPQATSDNEPLPISRRMTGLVALCILATLITVCVLRAAGPQLAGLQKSLRPKYDLAALNQAMDVLKQTSPAGSIVLTEDWDNFPVYFYTNSHNYYCVGLDPKFTQAKEPILWERYKAITRGQTPKSYNVPEKYRPYVGNRKKIRIRIQDIRDFFAAQYVLVDEDHKKFRKKLDQATTFCERIYPLNPKTTQTQPSANNAPQEKTPPYVIYRVLPRTHGAAAK